MDLTTDLTFAYNVLYPVFKHLDIRDLINCGIACEKWKPIIAGLPIWKNYEFVSCIYHLKQQVNDIEFYIRNIRVTDDNCDCQQMKFIARLLKGKTNGGRLAMRNVKSVFLHALEGFRDLTCLEVTNLWTSSDYFRASNWPNLVSLHLVTKTSILIDDFGVLQHLKHFYLDASYSRGFFNKTHIFLANLSSFGCYVYSSKEKIIDSLLSGRLKFIDKLRINYVDDNLFNAITLHENLKSLQLDLEDVQVNYTIDKILECSNLREFTLNLIINKYVPKTPTMFQLRRLHCSILKCVEKLKMFLKQFNLTFDYYYATRNERAVQIFLESTNPLVLTYNPCKVKMFSCLYLQILETLAQSKMPETIVRVYSEKYVNDCVLCSKSFQSV